ncbi:MAG: SDR family NAD(P)-dependent oxidoreductase [Sandaracinobacteroides sp.]
MTRARTVLVTGAASGIGAAIAAMFHARGHRVASADIAHGEFAKPASDRFAGSCDVRDCQSVGRFVAAASAHLGPVEILVNNAGIYPMQPFATITPDVWRNVMATNVDSVFHFCSETLPTMRASGWGRIINIASNSFFLGLPNLSHYIASKGAMIGLSRSLAAEVGGDGVTVNCIAPNFTRTEGTAAVADQEPELVASLVRAQSIPRLAMPSDILGTVAFLASDEAAFLTGQTLVVDGGHAKL